MISIIRSCPGCLSQDVQLIGSVEADQAVLGTDENVFRCDDCHMEWVQEKVGSRIHLLAEPWFRKEEG